MSQPALQLRPSADQKKFEARNQKTSRVAAVKAPLSRKPPPADPLPEAHRARGAERLPEGERAQIVAESSGLSNAAICELIAGYASPPSVDCMRHVFGVATSARDWTLVEEPLDRAKALFGAFPGENGFNPLRIRAVMDGITAIVGYRQGTLGQSPAGGRARWIDPLDDALLACNLPELDLDRVDADVGRATEDLLRFLEEQIFKLSPGVREKFSADLSHAFTLS